MESSSLLDPSAFLGEPHDGRRDANAFVGEARFDGCVTVTAWRRADAAALLPPELVLAPRVRDTREAHPVMTLFGTQWDGVMRFAGLAWPSGPPYHEVGVAVPFVTRRDGHALHLYMARMYASYPPAPSSLVTSQGCATVKTIEPPGGVTCVSASHRPVRSGTVPSTRVETFGPASSAPDGAAGSAAGAGTVQTASARSDQASEPRISGG